MAKIGDLPHHASKSMGTATPPATPSLIEAAHTPVALPHRSSVTDSDATRVDTASHAPHAEPHGEPEAGGETTMDKVRDTLGDFTDDLGIDIRP